MKKNETEEVKEVEEVKEAPKEKKDEKLGKVKRVRKLGQKPVTVFCDEVNQISEKSFTAILKESEFGNKDADEEDFFETGPLPASLIKFSSKKETLTMPKWCWKQICQELKEEF